jgi:predicted transcriptional regulator
MSPLSLQVLQTFKEMGADRLDLHVLFEAAGNIPAEREKVLGAIDELVREGLLEATGSDYYTLTPKGRESIARH